MPDLAFQILGVEPAVRGLAPQLHFKLRITAPEGETVEAMILQVQIQIQSARRHYNTAEKEKAGELFGSPERWGETLRNKLWTIVNTTVGRFAGATEAVLSVPCTFDLNVIATKYFTALEEGDVPLLFLFSGTVFHNVGSRLQVEQISWNKETAWRMPLEAWREMMDHHYPNTAWITLDRDLFERLHAFKRHTGAVSWDQAIGCLLDQHETNASQLAQTGAPETNVYEQNIGR